MIRRKKWMLWADEIWGDFSVRWSLHGLSMRAPVTHIRRPWSGSSLYQMSMMTSSNGNIFRVTGHLCGNSPVPGEFPAQRPVPRSFDVFFDVRLNKGLNKQSSGWWFETLSRPFWRHRNVMCCLNVILSSRGRLNRITFWQGDGECYGGYNIIHNRNKNETGAKYFIRHTNKMSIRFAEPV